jgi:hypothetical protein
VTRSILLVVAITFTLLGVFQVALAEAATPVTRFGHLLSPDLVGSGRDDFM